MTGLAGIARAFAMTDAVWQRHANPWSAWSRVWIGWWALALVLEWLWLNPRAFPRPRLFEAWASRAGMGEKVLIVAGDAVPRHRRMAALLSWTAVPGIVQFLWRFWVLRLDLVLLGGALGVLRKVCFLDRMVWLR